MATPSERSAKSARSSECGNRGALRTVATPVVCALVLCRRCSCWCTSRRPIEARWEAASGAVERWPFSASPGEHGGRRRHSTRTYLSCPCREPLARDDAFEARAAGPRRARATGRTGDSHGIAQCSGTHVPLHGQAVTRCWLQAASARQRLHSRRCTPAARRVLTPSSQAKSPSSQHSLSLSVRAC